MAQMNPRWTKNSPSMADVPAFTADNSAGYTADEMSVLNEEFNGRWKSGEWANLTFAEALHAFQDEGARR